MAKTVGDLLVEEGLVTEAQIEEARRHGSASGQRLGESLIELGYVNADAVASMLSRRLSIPAVDPRDFDVSAVANLVPAGLARKYRAVPLSSSGFILTVATAEPTDLDMIEDLRFSTGYHIEVVVSSDVAIQELLDEYYGSEEADSLVDDEEVDALDEETDEIDLAELEKSAEEPPVVKLCNSLLSRAVKRGADGILLECYEWDYRCRFRIDGLLSVVMNPPMKLRDAIHNHIKRMAGIPHGRPSGPQRGEIRMRTNHRGRVREHIFDVTTWPTRYGETVSLKVNPMERAAERTAERVFSALDPGPIEQVIAEGHGLVLLAGPPESGRTSTLLSLLTLLDLDRKLVSTISSEIRFRRRSISQVSWHDALSCRDAIRSALTQNPDVLVFDPGGPGRVLELIREGATQRLVFATLEARDTVSAVRRVLEHPEREKLGLSREAVLGSIRLAIAQRRLRRLCSRCRLDGEAPVEALRHIGLAAEAPLEVKLCGAGCYRCNRLGYLGTVAVFEKLSLDDSLRRSFNSGATDGEIREEARQRGQRTLADEALQLLLGGDTSSNEVLRYSWR